jgi:hypothetical protein
MPNRRVRPSRTVRTITHPESQNAGGKRVNKKALEASSGYQNRQLNIAKFRLRPSGLTVRYS